MRKLLFAACLAASASFLAVSSASAAPATGSAAIARAVDQTSDLSAVAGGCGRGWHRNWRGRCVPNRRWRRRL